MERLAATAIELINELHTERLHYESEYLPLIEAANRLADYEDSSLDPEEVQELAKYKKDNRIYILPSAIGSKVYVISERTDDFSGYPYPVIIQASFRVDMISDLHKRVFLTMEEAEDAVVKNKYEVL